MPTEGQVRKKEDDKMKVTSFNPVYGTKNIDEAAAFFAGLGFKEIHKFVKEGFEIRTYENEAGLRMDIMNSDYVREADVNGFFACRLNVDDLQEAIDYFEKNGGETVSPVIHEGDSRDLVNIRTKNGDFYSVIQHIK